MNRRGFTLLEIVIVMGLIGVLLGTAFLSANAGAAEKRLRQLSSVHEDLIYRARSLAILQQRTYQVTFRDGRVELAPAGQVVEQQLSRRDLRREERYRDELAVEKSKFPEVRESVSYDDEEVKIEVLRWGAKNFTKIERDKVEVLKFVPTGLAEPVTVRTTVGPSYLQISISPLSGGVRDEEMVVVKE